jgi:hypothetical protein
MYHVGFLMQAYTVSCVAWTLVKDILEDPNHVTMTAGVEVQVLPPHKITSEFRSPVVFTTGEKNFLSASRQGIWGSGSVVALIISLGSRWEISGSRLDLFIYGERPTRYPLNRAVWAQSRLDAVDERQNLAFMWPSYRLIIILTMLWLRVLFCIQRL